MEHQIFEAKEVFTPTKPARIAFIDRETINERLVNALQMPGKQLIVYGHSGSGKTTLLANKLRQLYEGHITTHCMKGMKFDQLILDAFDQLGEFYISERTSAQKRTVAAELTSSYLAIQNKINASETNESATKEQRIIPPQLTPQALGKLLGGIKFCWILEDFHKIDEAEKSKLSQLMKVFMDLSDEYDDLKIIALGAVDTARQVIQYDSEMRNRVAEILVELMTEKEIESIVEKGEQALNISFPSDLKKSIAQYSNGLASVCHHICLFMCNIAGVQRTTETTTTLTQQHFEAAIKLYAEEASDSIRSAFDKAFKQRRKTKLDHISIALEHLSTYNDRGASRSQLLAKIRKKHLKYPEATLKSNLQKLTQEDYGSIVRYDQTSGLHSFSDPFYHVFALAHFHKSGQSGRTAGLDSLFRLIESEFLKKLPNGIPNGTKFIISTAQSE